MADPHTMLAAYHGKLGNDCMDSPRAHAQRADRRGAAWVAGNYNFPLVEVRQRADEERAATPTSCA